MISEIDIRDWDKAEGIIERLDITSEQYFENGVMTNGEYRFLMGLINRARAQPVSKLPAILSWWKPYMTRES